jgi:hypothetical protein
MRERSAASTNRGRSQGRKRDQTAYKSAAARKARETAADLIALQDC